MRTTRRQYTNRQRQTSNPQETLNTQRSLQHRQRPRYNPPTPTKVHHLPPPLLKQPDPRHHQTKEVTRQIQYHRRRQQYINQTRKLSTHDTKGTKYPGRFYKNHPRTQRPSTNHENQKGAHILPIKRPLYHYDRPKAVHHPNPTTNHQTTKKDLRPTPRPPRPSCQLFRTRRKRPLPTNRDVKQRHYRPQQKRRQNPFIQRPINRSQLRFFNKTTY